MSIVKWGIKKFNRFRWGQQNRFYIYNNLFEYLPTFVNADSVFLQGFFKAIATVLLHWYRAVHAMNKYHLRGVPGRKYANENWKIFINSKVTNSELANLIKTLHSLHSARGTKPGMPVDVRRLTGDKNASTEFYGENDCSWWLDITYPEIGPDGLPGRYNEVASFVDLENALFVKYYNFSGLTDKIISYVLLREIIPVALNIFLIQLQPVRLKWGPFRFGTRRFGQLIYPK